MNEELNLNCIQVNNAITWLVDEFGKRYYDEYRLEWIDRREEELHYNFKMNDDYWNIDQVYTALRFDMPGEVIHKYKEYELKVKEGETCMNLRSFYFMKKYEINE